MIKNTLPSIATDDNLLDDKDTLTRCLLDNHRIRAVAVSLTDTWNNLIGQRQIPSVIKQLLGDLCAAAPLLASTLKIEGSLILQMQGDEKSPIRLVVVEYTAHHTLRCAIKLNDNKDNNYNKNNKNNEDYDLQSLVNAEGFGRFMVILDPLNKHAGQKAYTSLVPIVGHSVAHSLDYYMANSEQLPTRLLLASNDTTCAGLLIQHMPDEGGIKPINIDIKYNPDANHDDDAWFRVRHLVQTVKPEELLTISPLTLLRRLFWQENPVAAHSHSLSFYCGCSRQKVQAMLMMLGYPEVESILEEQGTVEVNCDYCDSVYRFDAIDCTAMFSKTPTVNVNFNNNHNH